MVKQQHTHAHTKLTQQPILIPNMAKSNFPLRRATGLSRQAFSEGEDWVLIMCDILLSGREREKQSGPGSVPHVVVVCNHQEAPVMKQNNETRSSFLPSSTRKIASTLTTSFRTCPRHPNLEVTFVALPPSPVRTWFLAMLETECLQK